MAYERTMSLAKSMSHWSSIFIWEVSKTNLTFSLKSSVIRIFVPVIISKYISWRITAVDILCIYPTEGETQAKIFPIILLYPYCLVAFLHLLKEPYYMFKRFVAIFLQLLDPVRVWKSRKRFIFLVLCFWDVEGKIKIEVVLLNFSFELCSHQRFKQIRLCTEFFEFFVIASNNMNFGKYGIVFVGNAETMDIWKIHYC